jgi:sphinganine-1-phosphate aldolase
MEIRKAPLTSDFRCDVEAMRDLIDSNTVLLVVSCPDYAYGKFDPVPIIAQLAKERGIGCHADCCLGSYVGVFTEEAGFKLPYL